ncbi:ClpP/crotonase [Pleomassaria siparia CBS 279.74]|uniref:ClpP/crotonase n=1 Tax=Pleomassaria siparia CBS 279.74 TaxID=1314801 RepID=A0A6G1JQX4_9PLEO|nr:ClpP/crotonase [Pleomassaria siparia CBS 279.74]
MAAEQLFEVPILSDGASSKPTGTILCTSPAPLVYLLTFTCPPDNRLTTSFCHALNLALDIVEFSYPPGVLITTSGIAKFYSNGLDLEHAQTTPGFWENSLYKVFARLGTYPMPTIALLNGHAFAGGLMVSMYHDYRIFNPSKGFLCLNELEFGVPLSPAMSTVFKQKCRPDTYRSLVLEARRFPGKDALAAGIVDELGGLDEALKFIAQRKLTLMGKTGVYGTMKKEMFRESLAFIEGHQAEEKRIEAMKEKEKERVKQGKSRVQEWNSKSKAKL